MTFTEAALEVLRSAGEPLHYKKITELAIERNLLSHVGKTPEVTMSSRLAMMVKKDRGQAPIMKVKPGVFAIRESALQGQDLSPAALAAINEVEGLDDATPENGVSAGAEEQPKPVAAQLPGGDVFPEEEGDDDPILAGLEQETEGAERAGRRRRRRRRRGKGEKGEGPSEVSLRPEPPRDAGRAREPMRGREPLRDREPAREREREPVRSPDRDRDRNQSRDREPGRGRDRDAYREQGRDRDRGRSDEAPVDWNRQPGDGDLLGKDLADAVWAVMSRGDRVPHPFARVAELLVRRGRLSGNPAALVPTIAAAARADIARAELQRARPRFVLRAGRLALSEWLAPRSLARAEQDLLSVSDRYAGELRRALIQKLSELPTAGFAELLATWLNTEGITALRAVRRPGSSGSELHFAGTRKNGSEEQRLAIVVQRSGRDIDREAVIDVRGALHHYGQAASAWIVTTGRVTSGAREEAAMPAVSCALFDGMALATAMERLGIAVRRHVIAHHEIDYELLEALGDTPEQRERREREQERERRDFSQRSDGRGPAVGQAPTHEGSNAARHARGEADDVDDEARTLVPQKALTDADWDEESDDADDTDEDAAADSGGEEFAAHDDADAEEFAEDLDDDADELPNTGADDEAPDDGDADDADDDGDAGDEDSDEFGDAEYDREATGSGPEGTGDPVGESEDDDADDADDADTDDADDTDDTDDKHDEKYNRGHS